MLNSIAWLALKRAAATGTIASLLSATVAAALGRKDAGTIAAPINAISHWVWGDRAFAHHEPTLRHTLAGYAIHNAASIFWAFFYELRMRSLPRASVATVAGNAMATAGIACVVDYQCTPERLKPGYEHKLSKPSLFLLYASFGLGLAAGHLVLRRMRVP
jgi:hypothetical protein